MTGEQTLRERAEIACGLAWFVLDGCWMMEWRVACYIACAFAAFWAYVIIVTTPRGKPVALAVCAADTAWIMFNIFWAVGDLTSNALATGVAKALFFVGGFGYCVAVLIADEGRVLVLRPLRFLASLVRR